MIAPPARSTARWRLVATASLLALFAGCRAPVLEGLDEATANDLVAALAQAGIDARKAGDAAGHRVEVDEDRLADAWSAARAAGFPRAEAAEPPARLIASPAETQALDRARRGRQLAELLRFDPR
ncbi:MAG: hypothetical protein KC620_25485, partial [Myxococcales bacterium]|nr:hypothetical protein [Myxococcales bacterium]